MYEGLLHDIQCCAEVSLNQEKLKQLISNICNWSYAHRVGNGAYSEAEQAKLVAEQFWKLRDIE